MLLVPGEQEDYAAVLSLESVPVECGSRARLFSGFVLLDQGKVSEAQRQFTQIVSARELVVVEIVGFLGMISNYWSLAEEESDETLRELTSKLFARIDSPDVIETALRDLFTTLATPGGERRWLLAWDSIQSLANVPAAFLDALRPVAEYLRDRDESLLERLPSDQRVLADALLERFKTPEP